MDLTAANRLLDDSHGLPQSERMMILYHLTKPWIPGFQAVVISPLRTGLDEFLGKRFVDRRGMAWHYPTLAWWKAHAHASHPPDGQGCDVGVHIDFLTINGKNAEFVYGNMGYDNTIKIATPADFKAECEWWGRLRL